MKYIVVTGGVISGIGKGITSSSIGLLFQSMGYIVTMIKIDPYINVDAGTMSPYEHGECYVLGDGGECDLDLGNYERFLNIDLTRNHNITTGRVYSNVIQKERNGDYLGATVQVVPHITDEIMYQINKTSRLPINGKQPDICIIEVGGTIGDIEGLPFIESLQQMRSQSDDMFCFIHIAMAINNPEPKTKPIQHSISTLRSRGIFPDLLVIRATEILPDEIKDKLHRLCQINILDIVSNPNVSNIYQVPGVFNSQNICNRIGNRLQLSVKSIPDPYSKIVQYDRTNKSIQMGIVGKYITNGIKLSGKSPDTYLSLTRAIEHAAFCLNVEVNIHWLDSEQIITTDLNLYDCFIIPGGFGSRGINGKLAVTKFARESNTPLLGICLGMQIMVVEYYNAFCAKDSSNGCSREWSEYITSPEYIIDILPDQNNIMGGTMRLGNYTTKLLESNVMKYYNSEVITERHRHRYEVNNKYVSELEAAGLKFVGRSDNRDNTSVKELMEIVEISDHPFYVGCQFHPEYKSRYEDPHPLFVNLLKSTL